MSYLVLARKYRPRTFREVIGQEAVTSLLSGAIAEERIGHAYLFAGPRGTGKTTTARIFAKCLNCETGPTAEPCGACERCVAADSGAEVDIIELDAASHTGVDTIRELRDEVAYAPMRARRKVYIVDEVHMLSKAAFNALLKTLEEPPAHVVFLFATTEPHKVLDTILSRCQVLKLSALSEERIASRLEEVFRLEGVEAEEGVTEELARGARGGMRDALSLADKLLALAGDRPTLEDLRLLGGDGGVEQVRALLDRIEASDRAGVISLLAQSASESGELVAGVLDELRASLVVAHCGVNAPFLTSPESERAAAHARAERIGAARIELWMQTLLRARERMRILPEQAELVLEIALLDLCTPEATMPLAELLQRLEALERGGLVVESSTATPAHAAPSSPATPQPRATPDELAPARPAARPASTSPTASAPPSRAARATTKVGGPDAARALPSVWAPFLAELGAKQGALSTVLEEFGGASALVAGPGPDEVRLVLGGLDAKSARMVEDRRNRAAAARAFAAVAGGRTLTIEVSGSASHAAPRTSEARTPAEPEARPETPTAKASERAKDGGTPAAAAASEAPAGATKDALTDRVADLFGGFVEDIG